MKIVRLDIEGFRGIECGTLQLGDFTILMVPTIAARPPWSKLLRCCLGAIALSEI